MTIYIKDNHTVIKADNGNFLMRKDGEVYGVEVSLGCYGSADNYDELPMDQWPDQTGETIDNKVDNKTE